MFLTLQERMEQQEAASSSQIAVQHRDTLDEFAALWKANREGGSGITDVSGPTQPYRQHSWVYSCCSAIARNVSGVPYSFRYYSSREDIPDTHWLWDLFSTPNPLTSAYNLWYSTEVYLNLGGNCLWVPVPSLNGREYSEFWVFGRSDIEAQIRSNQFAGWKVTWNGYKDFFEPWEVIHYKYFNPYHPVYGMAPLEAARAGVDQDWWAKKYNAAFFQNFAEPGTIISVQGKLTDKQIEQTRTSFEARHQGFNKAKRVAIVQGGGKVYELGRSHRDMDFGGMQVMNRQEIMSAFRVPPAEMMLFDRVSSRVESAGAQRKLFGEEVIAPELALIASSVQSWLNVIGLSDIEFYFDTSEVSILQESRTELLDQAERLNKLGYTANEINEKIGLGMPTEDAPWRDEWWVEGNKVPASQLVGGEENGNKNNKNGNESTTESLPATKTPSALLEAPKVRQRAPEDDEGEGTGTGTEGTGSEGKKPDGTGTEHKRHKRHLTEEEVRRTNQLKRWLFESRNMVLRGIESGSVADLPWDVGKIDSILGIASGDFLAHMHHVVASCDKQQVKSLFSFLRQRAPDIIRWASGTGGKQHDSGDMTLDDDGNPTFSYEYFDRDVLWAEHAAFLDPHEREYTASLRSHFTGIERDYMQAFNSLYRGTQGDKRVAAQEPEVDWNKHDDSLVRRSKRRMERVVVEAGKCSRLTPSRAARAKATHVPATRKVQQRALAGEKEVARAVGGDLQKNNEPMDVIAGRNGIEVKTLTTQTNSKITMHGDSLKRKLKYVRKYRLKGWTVAVDARGARPEYYYRKGFGSFRLGSMKKVESLEELAEIIK